MPTAVLPGLHPPPNTSLARLSPCGQLLLAFDLLHNELVAYWLKGVNQCIVHVPEISCGAGPAAGPAIYEAAPAQRKDATQSTAPAAPAPPQQSQQQQQQHLSEQGQEREHHQYQQHQHQYQPSFAFQDVFVEAWRASPLGPASEERLAPGLCLVAGGGALLIVASATPCEPQQLLEAEGLLPLCDSITFYCLRAESGELEGQYRWA